MRRIVPSVRTLVLICALSLSVSSKAQSILSNNGKWEIGLGLGPSFALTDIQGNQGEGQNFFIKDVNLPMTRFAKGAFLTFHPSALLGFRLSINQMKLEGNDALIKDKGGDERLRKERNLSFETNIIEGSITAEIYPTVLLEEDPDDWGGKIRPYAFAGFGMIRFNPKAPYYNQAGTKTMVELRPLHTEGQNMDEYPDKKEYGWYAPVGITGIGITYGFTSNFTMGIEINHRVGLGKDGDYFDDVHGTYPDASLFAKYLRADQVPMAQQLYFRENFDPTNQSITRRPSPQVGEQRGDPKHNDAYFSTILRMGWRLGDGSNSRAMNQLRCPSFY